MATIEARGLRKAFGTTIALDGVDLCVEEGHILGLIGPNGAGKTTVFNACSGLVAPRSGKIRLSGRNVTRLPAAARARTGLGRTFQQMELFDSLSVLDNVLVGFEASKAGGGVYSQVIARRGERRRLRGQVQPREGSRRGDRDRASRGRPDRALWRQLRRRIRS